MAKNKAGRVNTHFKSPSPAKKSLYMRFGYEGERLAIARRSLPHRCLIQPVGTPPIPSGREYSSPRWLLPTCPRPANLRRFYLQVPKQLPCFRWQSLHTMMLKSGVQSGCRSGCEEDSFGGCYTTRGVIGSFDSKQPDSSETCA
jgi:hypothetical protein